MSIFLQAAQWEKENRAFALAVIVESKGSTPRHQGQMLVLADGQIFGTIGGGMVERRVIEAAQEALKTGQATVFQGRMTRSGDDAVGSDCGGSMTIHISVHGVRPRLVLVGAGHVNRALAEVAAKADFSLCVLDTYAESLEPSRFPPGTQFIHASTYPQAVEQARLTENDFVVVATNHQDEESLQALMPHSLRYLGLLASRRKILSYTQRLRELGVSEEKLAHLYAPIGLHIGAETPSEIAVSIMAEILQVKTGSSGRNMRDSLHPKRSQLVVIRGAGDIATGVALRLFRAGFRIVMLDTTQPTAIRRTVSFAQAIFDGQMQVEGIWARRVANAGEAKAILSRGEIAILVDPHAEHLGQLQPGYLVDAILAKRNMGTKKEMAPITIALGPGFTAGEDCDAVIETNRGHNLGRVILQGCAEQNTGIPGNIAGYSVERVIRAPVAGVFEALVNIGELVQKDAPVARIGEHTILAPLAGMVRGLLQNGLTVPPGFKVGDIDPRGAQANFMTASDKALAIGGGVLEAMLSLASPGAK